MNNNIYFFLAFLSTILCLIPQGAWGQTSLPSYELISTGIATVNKVDMARTQNEAIVDAQKKALIQAVGMLLTFDHLEKQFPSLRESIFARPEHYIKSYRVLYENTIADHYYLTLKSEVDFPLFEEDLISSQLLPPQPKLPRILLMLAHQRLHQSFYTCWWSFIDPLKELTPAERTIKSTLQKKRLEVFDHAQLLPTLTINKVYGCTEVKPETIKTLATQFNAEVVIVGTIEAVRGNSPGGETSKKSVQVNISARAVNVATGTVFASCETFIPATEEDEEVAEKTALEKASSTFADQIAEEIISHWVKVQKGISPLMLRVSGISTYLEATQLRSDLKTALTEINSLMLKKCSREEVLFEAETPLDPYSLAERMKTARLENFFLTIKDISPKEITIEVTPQASQRGTIGLPSDSNQESANHD